MRKLALIFGVLILSACSMPAPKYSPVVSNVQLVKKAQKGVKIGNFTAEKKAQSISLRGSSLQSPYNNSFAEYLKEAITQELKKAELIDDASNLSIAANIIENDLDATGFSVGEGIMKVEFSVFRAEQMIYQKTHTVTLSWESSFMGAIAIPNAQASYPKLVEKMLNTLYRDGEFIAALG